MNSAYKSRLILPLAALILVIVAWMALKYLSFAPDGLPQESGKTEKPTKVSIYYGPRNAIAVLPFNERSDSHAWLAQGFSRELIRYLAGTDGIQVSAATSSFFFDEGGPPEIIAQRLQVGQLLSGDVSLIDGRLEVTASLFDVRRKKVAWSASFERPLDDVGELQIDLLRGVVNSMLGSSSLDVPVRKPANGRAWLNFLEGRYVLGPPANGSAADAESLFRTALGLQADYAEAWHGLAEAFLVASPADVSGADAALAKALESEPGFADALGLVSYVQRNITWQWPASVETAQQALQSRPGDAVLMSLAGRALFSVGRFEEATQHLQDSIKRDPLNLSSRVGLGLAQEFAGEYEAALATYRKLIGLNREFPGAHAFRARVKILQDNPESALREADEELDVFWQAYARALAHVAAGNSAEAETLVESLIAEHSMGAAFQLAEILAFQGEVSQAFDWLQQAWTQRDGGMAGISGNRLLANLHDDPRWPEMLSVLGISLDDNGASD